jgi:hypothetical protein
MSAKVLPMVKKCRACEEDPAGPNGLCALCTGIQLTLKSLQRPKGAAVIVPVDIADQVTYAALIITVACLGLIWWLLAY